MSAIRGAEYHLIEAAIPREGPFRSSSALDILAEHAHDYRGRGVRVLDFGCGDGRGADSILRMIDGAAYFGVDIANSPEVSSRTRIDHEFRTYDGMHLPYEDQYFDIVFTSQVFEHVRHPDFVTQEIHRVLRPDGLFIGSMSYLEPYHSFSIFNYTPYGVYRLLTDNGFTLESLRPGPEGFSLIVRQLTRRRIGRLKLAYPAIRLAALLCGWDARTQNYLRLRFSGHICFSACRRNPPA